MATNKDNIVALCDSMEATRQSAAKVRKRECYQSTGNEDYQHAQTIIQRTLERGIDLTAQREDWLRIGFALSGAFGEPGRQLFQSVSSIYPGYDPAECDRQYDNCLHTGRGDVSLGTLVHLATAAGVDVGWEKVPEMREMRVVPPPFSQDTMPADVGIEGVTLPFIDRVEHALPPYIQEIVGRHSDPVLKEMALLSSITMAGSVMSCIRAPYLDEWSRCVLYVAILGSPGSKKGKLNSMAKMMQPVHESKRRLYYNECRKHEETMKQRQKARRGKRGRGDETAAPKAPPQRMHIIPGNNICAAIYQCLANNDGHGIIIETELSTLSTAMKQDYGDFSDILCKNWHSERITRKRRVDDEYDEIECSDMSILTSGVPQQGIEFFGNVERGDFSRTIFYLCPRQRQWQNITMDMQGGSDADFYYEKGKELYAFSDMLQRTCSDKWIEFRYTEEQLQMFNAFFSEVKETYQDIFGDEMHSSIVRLGHIHVRISMILSALWYVGESSIPYTLECSDEQFMAVTHIVRSLLTHMSAVYEMVPKPEKRYTMRYPMLNNILHQKLMSALPDRQFSTKEFIEKAQGMGIRSRSQCMHLLGKWCSKGIITRQTQGVYAKM